MKRKGFALALAMVMALGLASPAFAYEYTVEKGDSLWKIAREELGDGNKWKEIYEANKDTVKDPGLIYVGQKLEIPGLGEEAAQPAGVARLCEPMGDDQYLLLYDVPSQEGYEAAEEGTDFFYLYDAKSNAFQYFTSGKGLLNGGAYHLSVNDDRILYQNGKGKLFFIPRGGNGEFSHLTKSEQDYYVISPDGTKYVIRKENGIKVCDLQQDTLLAQTMGVTDVRGMEWSADSSRVAMVANAGADLAVWNVKTGDTFVYDVSGNKHTPEDWVDITRACVIGDGSVLLIDYLCETDVTFVFWDMAENRLLDQIEGMEDATILDISGNRILYEVISEEEGTHGIHILNCYDCSTKENTVLDRYEGFYTAGCFCEGDGVLVFRYDIKTKAGELVRIP